MFDLRHETQTARKIYHRRENLPGQLRGGAFSLQRTTLRTSRHPAHRGLTERIRTRRWRYYPDLLARRPPSGDAIESN